MGQFIRKCCLPMPILLHCTQFMSSIQIKKRASVQQNRLYTSRSIHDLGAQKLQFYKPTLSTESRFLPWSNRHSHPTKLNLNKYCKILSQTISQQPTIPHLFFFFNQTVMSLARQTFNVRRSLKH